MAKLAGAALKLFQTVLYGLTFGCAAIILGFYSYFLAVLSDRHLYIPKWEKAVEGISGAACVYLIFAVILTCCIGGISFFAFLAIVLDILFTAGFVALAILTRDGTRSCEGNNVKSPIGNGPANSRNGWGKSGFGFDNSDNQTYAVHLGLACRYNKACFAVAIIGAFLFAISAIVQLFLGRHHQREKRYGPSPANGYTKGSGRKFWQRRRGPRTTHQARDAEMTAGGAYAAHDIRPSHETGYTGSTVAPATATYDSHGKPVSPTHGAGGYHTGPTVNPYGYERNTAANY